MEFVVTDTKCAVDCQVLIVGAEPVGRVAACDLARQGVSVRVVDAAGVRLDASMLAGVHTDPAERRGCFMDDVDYSSRGQMGSAAELLIDPERAYARAECNRCGAADALVRWSDPRPRRPHPALACGVLPDRRHYRHLRLRNVVLTPSAPISNPGPGRRRGTRGQRAREVLRHPTPRDDDEYVWGRSRSTATKNTARGVGVDAPGRFWLRPRGVG
jgi:hypothetical protein